MAVDANIIIFERIREEVRAGLPMLKCIEIGFNQAKETILDSNITTLLAAIILILFGSGIVRGFAITLCISIIVSMYSALNITRWLLTCAINGEIISNKKVIG